MTTLNSSEMIGLFKFDNWNETDVRENVVVPLLKRLGYTRDSSNDIITEQPLSYPKLSLGRKKPSDPVLRGRPDYILDVEGRLRWVLEVKAPDEQITTDVREQAWSYSAHP